MAVSDDTAHKAAQNQALMREVNERIEQVADEVANVHFLCECANTDCIETLELSIPEYESIRSSPVRFSVKPGHSYSEVERILEENERYAVVEKIGEAAEVARRADPRSRA